jgi:hypothetical protein
MSDVDLGLRLVRHSPVPGFQLGFALYLPIRVIITLPGCPSHDLYPYALAASAEAAAERGELDYSEDVCNEALRVAQRLTSRHERRLVEFMVAVAQTLRLVVFGRWREAGLSWEQVAGIAGEGGRDANVARCIAAAAECHTIAGDTQAGIDLAKQALDLARATGAPTIIVRALISSGSALAESDPEQARRLLDDGLAQKERLGIETDHLATQATLAAALLNDWSLTLRLADRSIRHQQWGGQRPYLAGILNVVARALVATDSEAAARLQGAARHHAPRPTPDQTAVSGRSNTDSPEVPTPGSALISDLRHQTSDLLHDALDEGRLRQLRAEGEAMDSDQAAAYALEAIRRARQSTAEGGG